MTQYSHGAGCGCKLSPGVLSEILGQSGKPPEFDHLLVGNDTKDDAAVVALDGDTAIMSTTDFFMPIVDDPKDFGAIAAANAMSDIYAMGGKPIMAIAILGWPIVKIPVEVAGAVLEGGREICTKAGIPLAGGHSIDAPEPIFGLAVTGSVPISQIKKNSDGQSGDLLYLTKPLGIGVAATAQKKQLCDPKDLAIAKKSMMTLNKIGHDLSKLSYVNALTDVTGFGLGGHLVEVCEGSETSAIIHMNKVPRFDFMDKYIDLGCLPGGTNRNWKTYGDKITLQNKDDFKIMADPQTSGGLLISVNPSSQLEFEAFMTNQKFEITSIGSLVDAREDFVIIVRD